jgi:hypothetical protein
MKRISNFKIFSKKTASSNAIKLSEDNEIKRNEIAEAVKTLLSEMNISSLSDLTEDQRNSFTEALFANNDIDKIEEESNEK